MSPGHRVSFLSIAGLRGRQCPRTSRLPKTLPLSLCLALPLILAFVSIQSVARAETAAPPTRTALAKGGTANPELGWSAPEPELVWQSSDAQAACEASEPSESEGDGEEAPPSPYAIRGRGLEFRPGSCGRDQPVEPVPCLVRPSRSTGEPRGPPSSSR